ncbi:MAG: competence protein ComK [Firmicutes bacterium]|nr:competence protein ComK [Bacillota bacterium]
MRVNVRAGRRKIRTEVSGMLDRLLALVPAVGEDGRQYTVALLAGGERLSIPRKLKAVLRGIFLDLGLSVEVGRLNAAEVLHTRRDLPLVIPPGRPLACLPLADHSRLANGYVLADRIVRVLPLNNGLNRTVLVFDDGTEWALKTDARVVEARLARAARVAREMAGRWGSGPPELRRPS